MSEKTTRLTLRIEDNLKKVIEKKAKENSTTINNLIINLLEREIKKETTTEPTKAKIENEQLEILQDKIDYLIQKLNSTEKKITEEVTKELFDDFKIFANVLAKKIAETNKHTNYLQIQKPIKYSTLLKFAELNKKPFFKKNDLVAFIDVIEETGEIKIYKILEANTYNKIKLENIENKQEIEIDLTKETNFLSLLKIYRKI